ncbi:MAG TPA: 23S rRNA (guanosine(2251)-2'-O)-methyltransferase RlmB, partial [Chromatiales bacterium]|nr:23S rRNA (guanosine(2251)-2'-O)-methyltransferase RlmB [Chromatiales bacterium]
LDDSRWPVKSCDAGELTRLTGTAKHQGIAARVTAAVMLDEAEARQRVQALDDCLLLVLDGVQDPRNFGACLRTADAAGVDLVVVGRSRNVGITPVVSKVAAGATETQPVASVGNLARFLGWLGEAGVFVAGLAGEATDSLYSADLRGPLALVLGAEARGLRRLTRERCSALFRLPMIGGVESLNVSVAAGVSLYEARRQRGWLARSAGLG